MKKRMGFLAAVAAMGLAFALGGATCDDDNNAASPQPAAQGEPRPAVQAPTQTPPSTPTATPATPAPVTVTPAAPVAPVTPPAAGH